MLTSLDVTSKVMINQLGNNSKELSRMMKKWWKTIWFAKVKLRQRLNNGEWLIHLSTEVITTKRSLCAWLKSILFTSWWTTTYDYKFVQFIQWNYALRLCGVDLIKLVVSYLILLEFKSVNFGLTRSSPSRTYNRTIQNTAAFLTIDWFSSVLCKRIIKWSIVKRISCFLL